MSYFEQLWTKCCEHYDVASDLAAHWHKLIVHKYSSEPNRHQHNLNLLDKKCKFLTEFESTLNFSEYLIFTLAFQYYHFDSNELCTEMNCMAFRQFYGDSAINDHQLLHAVLTLLECAHGSDKPVPETELYQDLDLIALGSDPEEYKAYRERLRKEYGHLCDGIYTDLRSKVLKSLLKIPQIYRVAAINNELGAQARQNIQLELSELDDGEYV